MRLPTLLTSGITNMALDTDIYDRSSFAIRKELRPGLTRVLETLGLRSVGELVTMLSEQEHDAVEALKPVVTKHTQARDERSRIKEAMKDPQLRAAMLEKLER